VIKVLGLRLSDVPVPPKGLPMSKDLLRVELDPVTGVIFGVDYTVRTSHRPPRLGPEITIPVIQALENALLSIRIDENDLRHQDHKESEPRDAAGKWMKGEI
jgi:hypothetical protein